MRTIAVISQKGGAGKTTLALHIAVAAELAGYNTVLLDMDPQGTAEAWSEWRKEAPPVVIPAKVGTLVRTMEKPFRTVLISSSWIRRHWQRRRRAPQQRFRT